MVNDINNIDPCLLEDDDRIVSYLKGQMSAAEEQQFIKELEEKPELKEKAIITARLIKGLKEIGEEHDKIIKQSFLASSKEGVENVAKRATYFEEDSDISARIACSHTPKIDELEISGTEPKEEKQTVSIRKTYKWLSIAASVIIIFWIGFEYNDYRNTTGLGEEFDDAFQSSMIIRSADSPSEPDKKLKHLFSDVKENKNIKDAIHDLYICWELSTMETYNDYTDYSSEIGWYLAIAYLKDNDKKNASDVLERLVLISDNDSLINKKAKELLSRIKGN